MIQSLPINGTKYMFGDLCGFSFLFLFFVFWEKFAKGWFSFCFILVWLFWITILKSFMMYSFIFVYNLSELLSLLLTIPSIFVYYFSGSVGFSLHEKMDCQVALSYRNISVILMSHGLLVMENCLSYHTEIYLCLLTWFSPDI